MRTLFLLAAMASACSAQLNVLSLGDSTHLHPSTRHGFVVDMANDGITLNFEGLFSDGMYQHDAYGGTNFDTQLNGSTDTNYPGLANTISNYDPDIVLLMQGNNSVGGNTYTVPQIELQFDTLVDFIFANTSPGTVVLAGNLWDYAFGFNDQSQRVKDWNAALFANVKARRQQGQLIQIADHNTSIHNGMLAADGLHLNNMGHHQQGKTWYPAYQASAIPEPSAFLLLACLASLVAMRRYR